MTTLKATTCLASIAIGALWFSIAFTNFCGSDYPGMSAIDFFDRQQHIFYKAGYEFLSDYETPRNCAASKSPYMPDKQYAIFRKDACYPALALLLLKAFPQNIFVGGLPVSLISVALWTASLLLFMCGSSAKSKLLILATIVTGQIFLYSAERGNLIFLSAASLNLFLAWHDDPSPTKRRIAAMALGIATVLKISPAIMGLLYLRKRQWRDIFVSAATALVLFFAPFFMLDGIPDVLRWVENAAKNSEFYTYYGTWGGAPLFVSLYHFHLLPSHSSKLFLFICRAPFLIAAIGGGMAAILWSIRLPRMNSLTKDDVQALLILCMLIIPGNMLEYTGLYLIPVFIQWCLRSKQQSDEVAAIGFLLFFFQLQLFTVVRSNHFNLLVHNVGLLLIAGIFHLKAFKAILSRQ